MEIKLKLNGRNIIASVDTDTVLLDFLREKGITAAINSCGRLPHEKFAGGASTMWDLDSAWASTPAPSTSVPVKVPS